MSHNYGNCYFCGGDVVEKIIELEFRWRGQLYMLERVPSGICQQCGEKYFTAEVSEAIDNAIKSGKVTRMVNVPVKELKLTEV